LSWHILVGNHHQTIINDCIAMPSTHLQTRFIRIDSNACKACWQCIGACQQGVIGKVDLFFHKHSHIDHADKCIGCLKCTRVCPAQAITHIPKVKEVHNGKIILTSTAI
jgi:ferredoxin